MTDCFTDSAGCVVCPEVEGTPGTPARFDYSETFGWDAGANSRKSLSNWRLRYAFSAPRAHGMVSGLCTARRADPTDPNSIDFGFYLTANGGTPFYTIVERGAARTAPVQYAPGARFAVYRWERRILYAVNDRLVYESDTRYGLLVYAGVAFYASGDVIENPVLEGVRSLPFSDGEFEADLSVPPATLVALGVPGAILLSPSALVDLTSHVVSSFDVEIDSPLAAITAGVGNVAVLNGPPATVTGALAPSVPIYTFVSLDGPPATIELSSFVISKFEADIVGPFSILKAGVLDAVVLDVPVATIETALPSTNALFFVLQSPGYLSMWTGAPMAVIADNVQFSTVATTQLAVVIRSALQLRDDAAIIQRLLVTVASPLVFGDAVRNLFEMLVSSGLSLGDQSEAHRSLFASIADSLALESGSSATFSGDALVASVLALNDMLRVGFDLRVSSDIALVDQFTALAEHYVTLLDTVTFGDTVSAAASLTVLVSSPLALSDVIAANGAFNATVLSELSFTVRVRIDGVEYIGYAMNLKNAAVSEYENFPMTSMVEFDGRYFGTAADGVYELEGDDDDGENIDMLVRTALSDLGSSYLKKVLNSYIGYTSTGDVVLKVITTHRGEKHESWYKFASRTPDVVSNTRANIAKGIDSVYWQFELVNVDGADVSLETIKLWPFNLSRRYTGK